MERRRSPAKGRRTASARLAHHRFEVGRHVTVDVVTLTSVGSFPMTRNVGMRRLARRTEALIRQGIRPATRSEGGLSSPGSSLVRMWSITVDRCTPMGAHRECNSAQRVATERAFTLRPAISADRSVASAGSSPPSDTEIPRNSRLRRRGFCCSTGHRPHDLRTDAPFVPTQWARRRPIRRGARVHPRGPVPPVVAGVANGSHWP